jgi:signal transduction histidine kinase
VRRRIFICLAVLLALCVLGDAIALLCLNRSIAELSALAESHRIQVLRVNLTSSAVQIEADLMAFMAGGLRDAPRQRDGVQRFLAAMQACTACHHSAEAQAQLDQVHQAFHACAAAVDELLSSPADRDALALEREAHAITHELTRQATALADRSMHNLSVRGANARTSMRNAWITVIGTLLATLVVGGIVALHLQRRLTRPIDALLRGITLIRDGRTAHRFALHADREFRALGDALNQAYDSMAKAQENLLQAEKMAAVGRLAAGIAHEVGNPLASVSSVAQLMRRNVSNDEDAEQIDLILQHVARASRVVRGLLTFSRPASDERRLCVDVGKLLDEAGALLKYDKRAGHARVERRYGPGLAIERGDPDRLILVFTNIMINAFDAMSTHGSGDGQLTITAAREGDWIVVRFEDDGPGMTQEQITSAFDPFFTTKDPGTGTGLGLWVCHQVIEKHHGRIHIHSRVGAGATVTVELPCHATATPLDQPAARD